MSESAPRPQAVYFDSNPLIGAGWPFPTAQLLELVRKAHSAGIDVCLPELVYREISEHWLRGLRAKRQQLAEQIKSFNRDSLGLSKMVAPIELPKPEKLRATLATHTKATTDLFRFVPTKDRPASYYTDLALRRQGAFAEKGKGFHDTIILCCILDDMAEKRYTHAIVVSKDGGFRQEGVKYLADKSGVHLSIVESLADLELPVNDELSAQVVSAMKAAKKRVLDLAKSCEAQLRGFLEQSLDYSRNPLLPLTSSLVRREFLAILSFEDAHAADMFSPDMLKPRKGVQFSVDLQVLVREQTEEFSTTEPIGSLGVIATSIFQNPLLPMNILHRTTERKIAVTVECLADLTEKGVETISFAVMRETKSGGLVNLLGLE